MLVATRLTVVCLLNPCVHITNGFALQANLDSRLPALLATTAAGREGHNEDTDRKVGDSSSNMQNNDEQEAMA